MEVSGKGMRLLKKGQSGLRLLFGRMGIALFLLIAQFLLMAAIFAWFEDYIIHYYGSALIVCIVMVLHLLNKQMEPTIRIAWIVVVMAAPVFGSLLYLFTLMNVGHRFLCRATIRSIEDSKSNLAQDPQVLDTLKQRNSGAAGLCAFAVNKGDARIFRSTRTEYIPIGEIKLERMLQELEKAQKFIYMEYFIVSEGVMWGRILEVLARKAREGVDVRILYDGTCEFILLPKDYPRKLAKLGIQCKVFSPFKPFVSTHYNYRDHRKILVIDGKVAFNGGINLSDEYINVDAPFGHWKDTAVLLKGPAVRGFTRMFLQMWNMTEKTADHAGQEVIPEPEPAEGFVMPFADNPMDEVRMGHRVYSDILNRAEGSVDIMTPYLILDAEMENTLRYAAARGVRVRLLLPGIADKYVPYAIAKTHYRTLLDAGVEIYEYTPGFVHGKMVVSDGREAVVGTINFDYRSFYHHFECGTYLYGTDCIDDIEKDFEHCLEMSRRVTAQSIRKEKWHRKLIGYLLKGFSPLL